MILGWVTTKWRLKIGLIGDMRVAPYAEVILHTPFGGQTIVIPTHRVKTVIFSLKRFIENINRIYKEPGFGKKVNGKRTGHGHSNRTMIPV